ncbi:hypothetical protein VCHA34O109_10068 [Vibrio chagasii]|nr:hypothetical protein VCHA34O109_10068 [Vibrio chagasii]CAH6885965.1 hypothetical protein VCHA36P164_20154 [Vibrio chagasii]CAH7215090.1 hypothetical protein VCHA40P242_30154 [Vibrio chagasii]
MERSETLLGSLASQATTTFLRKLIALMTQEQSSQRLGAPFL